MKPHQRYSDAHKLGFDTQYPQAAQAGHYFKPSMPDCRTANGRVYARLGISETKYSIEAIKPQSCIYLVSRSFFFPLNNLK